MQAKDIPELDILHAIEAAQRKAEQERGYQRSDLTLSYGPDVHASLSQWRPKVIQARLRSMLRRKLIDGCACGCRGDWRILEAGRSLLDATSKDA